MVIRIFLGAFLVQIGECGVDACFGFQKSFFWSVPFSRMVQARNLSVSAGACVAIVLALLPLFQYVPCEKCFFGFVLMGGCPFCLKRGFPISKRA
jgi:hypothetical protein